MKRNLLAFALVGLACVGCDHATKHVATQLLTPGGGLSLLGGLVELELVANPGAFLSVGAGLPDAVRHFVLIGLVPLALGAVGWLVWRSPGAPRAQIVALGLVTGGGLANWLDRVMDDGAVTDFVSLGLGGLRTGIFNLADLAIVAGVLLLLRSSGASRRRPRDGVQ